MGISVRSATLGDIDWILSQLKIFSKLYGTKRSLYGDEIHCREGLKRTIEGHVFLLAVREDDSPLGFIAGLISPHLYNPAIRMLCELFWWVAEDARTTRAGVMLIDAFIDFGKKNADWITFGITEETPINEVSITKRGFHAHERSYLMEVSPCLPQSQ